MSQIRVLEESFFRFAFRMSFSYIPKTFGSLGRVWNFMLGEFLQLFVHLGTQQLALTMLFLVTLVFVTDNGVP